MRSEQAHTSQSSNRASGAIRQRSGRSIVDPKEPEPFSYDRDYVVVLSDWSDEDPNAVYAKLKKLSHYYNFRERTVSEAVAEIEEKGWSGFWANRGMWNEMRMSDRDISDVTGYTYTFLMNGVTPADGWLGLFKRGERVEAALRQRRGHDVLRRAHPRPEDDGRGRRWPVRRAGQRR